MKFILKTTKQDDSKAFLTAMYQEYVNIVLNPFYELHSPIDPRLLNDRVKTLLKQYKLE